MVKIQYRKCPACKVNWIDHTYDERLRCKGLK